MLSTIAKPFGVLLMWLYELVHNYGLAIILFALIVKVILLPFFAKSKKGTMRAATLTPKLREIQKKHGANKQKYNEEVSKLYMEEGVNPMGGCLWSLLPLPILIALYQAIRYPLTIMMGVAEEIVNEGGALYDFLYNTLGFVSNNTSRMGSAYIQLEQSQFITQNWAQYKDQFLAISDKITNIDYNFFGMDLGAQPNWKFFIGGEYATTAEWVSAFVLFLLPLFAAVIQFFHSKMTADLNSTPGNEQAEAQMQSMSISMPLMTLWFGYNMPAALCLYWIANSAFSMIQDYSLTKYYKKKIDEEMAVREAEAAKKEAEIEARRLETERLKAENATEVNRNTSKKKLHRQERQEQEGKAAEWESKHRPKKAVNADGDENEIEENPSQIGDRPYARGRAYDPDRFSRKGKKSNQKAVEEIAAESETDGSDVE